MTEPTTPPPRRARPPLWWLVVLVFVAGNSGWQLLQGRSSGFGFWGNAVLVVAALSLLALLARDRARSRD